MITTEMLRAWLDQAGRTRETLAEEIGAKKRTIDNWFTDEEIPLWAQKSIGLLQRLEQQPGDLLFSGKEWDLLEGARALLGFQNRDEFFKHCLKQYAAELTGEKPPLYVVKSDKAARIADEDDPASQPE